MTSEEKRPLLLSVKSQETFFSKLSWNNISISVKEKSNQNGLKNIINNISGEVKSGEMLAIMGASGAGKTTLLRALAGNLDLNKYIIHGGSVSIDTNILSSRRLMGFVYQHDLFINSLTVYEQMYFTASLRLPNTSRQFRKTLVLDLLFKVGLIHRKNSKIGSSMAFILSGGERKRLSFACAILHSPSLLFCDEPTTGLDSFSAQRLVKLMSDYNITVIASIHQPSSEIYQLFDNVLYLAEGGRVAYQGHNGFPCLSHFERVLGYICPIDYNPSDYIIQLIAVVPGSESESLETIARICDAFDKNNSFSSPPHSPNSDVYHFLQNKKNGQQRRNWSNIYFSVCILICRSFIDSYRNPGVHLYRIFVEKGIICIILINIYNKLDLLNPNQDSIQDLNGLLFMYIMQMTFPVIYGFLREFPNILPVAHREASENLYDSFSLYVGKTLSSLPGLILDALLFGSLLYISFGFYKLPSPIIAYCLLIGVNVIVSFLSLGFGTMIALSFTNPTNSSTTVSILTTTVLAISGFFMHFNSIPIYLSWVRFVSWFALSYEIFTIYFWSQIPFISCENRNNNTINRACLSNGADVLQSLSVNTNNMTLDLFSLVVIGIVFHIISSFLLFKRLKE